MMQQTFPEQSSHFILPRPDGEGGLELMTSFSSLPETQKKVAIICHPHPLYGGTMTNKVVVTMARAFETLGVSTVRFNFRGVGKSTGEYGHVTGEMEDLQIVLDWVKKVLPDYSLWLAGFSFGACVSAGIANQTTPERLLSVAPAVNHCDFQRFTNIKCPWLVIQGDQDEVVPFEQVEAFAKHPPSPLKLMVMKDTSHFFHGKLVELREIIIKEWSH